MRKILIFGNSSAGKSTLAKRLSEDNKLSHLDLDTLAWQPTTPPTRMPLTKSKQLIDEFILEQQDWVIEGCYADLLELVSDCANEIIFLDMPVEVCVKNAKQRPWEPHKYKSKAEQDANLSMLIEWIKAYTDRDDTFSYSAHKILFDSFGGKKRRVNHYD